MKLNEYLERTTEPLSVFSTRADVAESTLRYILGGGGTRTETAIKIRKATGGLVDYPDLVPAEPGRLIPACTYNLFYRMLDERFYVEEGENSGAES